MTGKKWTAEQETELRRLVEANAELPEIAAKLQRSPGLVIVKVPTFRPANQNQRLCKIIC